MRFFEERKAIGLHAKGKLDEAYPIYDKLEKNGELQNINAMLGFAIVLIKRGEFERAAKLLRQVDTKKPDKAQKTQMLTYYGVAIWKLGNVDRAIEILEEVYRKGETGLIYSILGYIIIDSGDFEKAKAFNEKAVEYDDEDPICLDNLAQTYYRIGHDKINAKPLFEKALSFKPESIDTNYFLALYDIEDGNYEAARLKLEMAGQGKRSPLNYVTDELIEQAMARIPQ